MSTIFAICDAGNEVAQQVGGGARPAVDTPLGGGGVGKPLSEPAGSVLLDPRLSFAFGLKSTDLLGGAVAPFDQHIPA